MAEEIKNWLRQAEEDYDNAKYNFHGGKYPLTTFLCQQTVEKALKALLIKKTGKFPKIHDLVRLGKLVELPQNLIDNVKELTLAYIYARYPDVKQESDLKEKAFNFLKTSEQILKWTKENL